MPSIVSLLPKLSSDFPQFSFVASDTFLWSPERQTVFYDASSDDASLLLHELSHGILEHKEYSRDIELVSIEAAAWEQANRLGPTYEVVIDADNADAHLDTYREWMHARSTCPGCEATGYQSQRTQYRCVACGQEWRVNEARLCALRRHSVQA